VLSRSYSSKDYRDTKIVALAKKCRTLTVALNKERGLSRTAKDKLEGLQDENERLKKELDLVSSPAARAAATRNIRERERDGEEEGGGGDARKELAQAQKQVEISLSFL
jgi:hypothetical protein